MYFLSKNDTSVIFCYKFLGFSPRNVFFFFFLFFLNAIANKLTNKWLNSSSVENVLKHRTQTPGFHRSVYALVWKMVSVHQTKVALFKLAPEQHFIETISNWWVPVI